MTHKVGICLPKTVEEALEIDRDMDTDFRGMAKVTIAWKTRDCLMPQQAREGDASDLIGYQEINVTSCLMSRR